MAKKPHGNNISEDWLKAKGYTENKDGSWQPPKFVNPLTKEPDDYQVMVASTPFVRDVKSMGEITPRKLHILSPRTEHIFVDTTTTINKPNESVLKIDGLVAGLNGDKGLMRAHWSNNKKQKDLYKLIINQHLQEGKIKKHEGQVSIQYIGYKSVLMDWDNFGASFKHIGDSLVKCGILVDDNPKIVTQFIPQQIKCIRAEQKVIVIIKDI